MRVYLHIFAVMFLLMLGGCSGESLENLEGESGDQQNGSTQQVVNGDTEPATAGPPLNLDYIHDDFSTAVIFQADAIRKSELFVETRKAMGDFGDKLLELAQKEGGWDPIHLTQAILLVGPMIKDKDGRDRENVGIILRFDEPVDQEQVTKELLRKPIEKELEGKSYFTTENRPRGDGVYFPDPQTMVFAPHESFELMLNAEEVDSQLVKVLNKVDTNKHVILAGAMEPLRPMVAAYNEKWGKRAPPEVIELLSMVNEIDTVVGYGDLTGDKTVHITFTSPSDSAAEKVEGFLTKWQGVLQELDRAPLREEVGHELPAEAIAPLFELGEEGLAGVQVKRDQANVSITLARPASLDELPEKIGEVLPQAAKKSANAAEQFNRMNDIRMLVIAMSTHEADKSYMPAAYSTNKEGEPLLSWRVHILPYLEQEALYNQFKLDEPWDSEHNRELIEKMPAIFGEDTAGKTRYQVFVSGDDQDARHRSMFRGGTKTNSTYATLDGMSNTIMIVETGPDKAVPWTKPADVAFDYDNPREALGDIDSAGFPAVFCDGHTEMIAATIDAAVLAAMVTPKGREVITSGLDGSREIVNELE